VFFFFLHNTFYSLSDHQYRRLLFPFMSPRFCRRYYNYIFFGIVPDLVFYSFPLAGHHTLPIRGKATLTWAFPNLLYWSVFWSSGVPPLVFKLSVFPLLPLSPPTPSRKRTFPHFESFWWKLLGFRSRIIFPSLYTPPLTLTYPSQAE